MPREISEITELKMYLRGVLERADHHANNVDQIVLALVGAVVLQSEKMKVRTQQGKTANLIWFETNRGEYVLAYNHEVKKIELRERVQTGKVIAKFDNESKVSEVRELFDTL